MRKAAVIANPQAGPGRGQLSGMRAATLLREHGLEAKLHTTAGPGQGTILAREAAASHDLVVAVGGDGTVHEVAAGLAGTDCPLGVLPAGSGNDFAMGIGCPDPASGLAAIVSAKTMACDTGRLDDRFFVNSVGLLASGLVSLRAARLWRWLGRKRYLVASLSVLFSYRGQEVRWRITQAAGGDVAQAGKFLMAEICNGPSTGGGFRFAPEASFDDGLLDSCLIRPVGLVAGLQLLGPASRGESLDHKAITLVQTSRIAFTISQPAGYHLDGEPGMLPAGGHVIEIDPGNLKVLVP